MQLHRTYGGCQGNITSLDWSPDSQWVAVGSKDLTARSCASLIKALGLSCTGNAAALVQQAANGAMPGSLSPLSM